MRDRAWRAGRWPMRSQSTWECFRQAILGHHRKRSIDLQTSDDAAAGGIKFGPEAIVVIAQVEHICGARPDRHRLGHGDVVDIGGRELGEARTRAVRIINNMQLGPRYTSTEPGPVGAQRAQSEAGGIDQICGIRNLLAQPAFTAAHQLGQKSREYRAGSLCIGIGQCRARHFATTEMIEFAGVARQSRLRSPLSSHCRPIAHTARR